MKNDYIRAIDIVVGNLASFDRPSPSNNVMWLIKAHKDHPLFKEKIRLFLTSYVLEDVRVFNKDEHPYTRLAFEILQQEELERLVEQITPKSSALAKKLMISTLPAEKVSNIIEMVLSSGLISFSEGYDKDIEIFNKASASQKQEIINILLTCFPHNYANSFDSYNHSFTLTDHVLKFLFTNIHYIANNPENLNKLKQIWEECIEKAGNKSFYWFDLRDNIDWRDNIMKNQLYIERFLSMEIFSNFSSEVKVWFVLTLKRNYRFFEKFRNNLDAYEKTIVEGKLTPQDQDLFQQHKMALGKFSQHPSETQSSHSTIDQRSDNNNNVAPVINSNTFEDTVIIKLEQDKEHEEQFYYLKNRPPI